MMAIYAGLTNNLRLIWWFVVSYLFFSYQLLNKALIRSIFNIFRSRSISNNYRFIFKTSFHPSMFNSSSFPVVLIYYFLDLKPDDLDYYLKKETVSIDVIVDYWMLKIPFSKKLLFLLFSNCRFAKQIFRILPFFRRKQWIICSHFSPHLKNVFNKLLPWRSPTS